MHGVFRRAVIENDPVMNREHITSEQIWFLLTVWDTRSITLTAQQLNVSVATASRQMTTLRGLLHDPLFLRGRDGLVPTARMNELLPKLRAVQDELIDIVRRPAQFSPADLRSTIRVAGVDNAIFGFLMPCLRELYGAAPGLHLSCVPLTDDFPRLLASGNIDVAFYAPPLPLDSDYRELELFATDHVPVVRKDHPLVYLMKDRLREGGELRAEDLAPYREIRLTYGSLEGKAAVRRADDRVAMDCGYYLASAFFLLETDFYVMLPTFTAKCLVKELPLAILPAVPMANAVVWKARMIWHERTERDPALQWFRSVIAEKLRGLNPDEVAKKLSESFDLYDPVWDLSETAE